MNIRYISSSLSPSGYASAARADITALFCSGVTIMCENIQQTAETTNYGLEGDIMKYLQRRKIPYKISIIHLTPDCYEPYMEKGKYHIGRLIWECEKLPQLWIEPLNKLDEIWVATDKQVEHLKSNGITTPAYAIPEPIYTQRAEESIEPFQLSEPKDFIFYSIFQFINRKNPRGLLRAYWKEFQHDEKVTLLLKTYRVNYSESEYTLMKNEIESWKNELSLPSYPKIYLVNNLLTDEQVIRLHKTGNVYVSPSSAEGWNRPMQEAMLYGNPVISGNVGGITDYVSDSHYFRVNTHKTHASVQSHIPYYTENMEWYDLDEDELGKQMRFVYEQNQEAEKKSEAAKDYVVKHFSFQTVGDSMKKRLEEIEKII